MSSDYVVVRSGALGLPDEVVNSTLSIGAVGLLMVILMRPAGVDLGPEQFVSPGSDLEVVEGLMQELSAAGHRHEFSVSSQGGDVFKIVIYSDVSISPATASERFFQARIHSCYDEARGILQ